MKQRQIKFRAWDKRDKVMREVYGIQFPKISNKGNRENTLIEMHCSDYEGSRAIILSDFIDSIERVELMQFTGMLDSKGKEIYEGDIIRTEQITEYGKGNVDETVYFSGGAFYPISTQPEETWEIIGNVFESIIKKSCGDENCKNQAKTGGDFCQFHCDNLPF